MNKLTGTSRSFMNLSNVLVRSLSTTLTSSNKVIDLRSDTVTKPSPEMLKVMFQANVGDDVYKEDETVNELERVVAEMFGMEKALFVPTGTMGNLLCIMAHCKGRGEELIIGSSQHVYKFEQGHFMQLASVAARAIPNQPDGTMPLLDIENNINNNEDFHSSETKLICLENTHMLAGGIPLSNDFLNQVGAIGKKHNVPIHVDGARLFNAAVATNQSLVDLLTNANSVSMCLSKGLGCPIGSVIGGSEELIWTAMRMRKALGGGIRQGGYLAAAGLYALEHGDIYIEKDHSNAKLLADVINSKQMHDIIQVDSQKVKTNIIYMEMKQRNAEEFVERLKEHNVLSLVFSDSLIRMVTHRDVSEEDILKLNDVLSNILKNYS